MTHDNTLDYNCPRCHWVIRSGIPHECNYMICHKCNGLGKLGWRGKGICDWCNGTGQWTQRPDEPTEDNEIGVLA